jgi:hypothetical protein
MAERTGLSKSTLGRIWRDFGLEPHRADGLELSTDPLPVEKVHAVVGLFANPPEGAVVLSVERAPNDLLQRSGHRSVSVLEADIRSRVDAWNENPTLHQDQERRTDPRITRTTSRTNHRRRTLVLATAVSPSGWGRWRDDHLDAQLREVGSRRHCRPRGRIQQTKPGLGTRTRTNQRKMPTSIHARVQVPLARRRAVAQDRARTSRTPRPATGR